MLHVLTFYVQYLDSREMQLHEHSDSCFRVISW